MSEGAQIACSCGAVAFALEGDPIIAAECHCASCREAGGRLEALPAAPPIRETNCGTRFALWRKDRVRLLRGADHLSSFRLKPDSPTERVVATCCNAPMYLSFKHGHWLSLYARRWPDGIGPTLEERTMTGDLPDRAALPDDVPNSRRQSARFFAKLLWAWARMGFRNPNVVDVKGELNA